MPNGYPVSNGYFGLVDGSYMLFSTEGDYYEYLNGGELDDES